MSGPAFITSPVDSMSSLALGSDSSFSPMSFPSPSVSSFSPISFSSPSVIVPIGGTGVTLPLSSSTSHSILMPPTPPSSRSDQRISSLSRSTLSSPSNGRRCCNWQERRECRRCCEMCCIDTGKMIGGTCIGTTLLAAGVGFIYLVCECFHGK